MLTGKILYHLFSILIMVDLNTIETENIGLGIAILNPLPHLGLNLFPTRMHIFSIIQRILIDDLNRMKWHLIHHLKQCYTERHSLLLILYTMTKEPAHLTFKLMNRIQIGYCLHISNTGFKNLNIGLSHTPTGKEVDLHHPVPQFTTTSISTEIGSVLSLMLTLVILIEHLQ
jgi:hypothetical protein